MSVEEKLFANRSDRIYHGRDPRRHLNITWDHVKPRVINYDGTCVIVITTTMAMCQRVRPCVTRRQHRAWTDVAETASTVPGAQGDPTFRRDRCRRPLARLGRGSAAVRRPSHALLVYHSNLLREIIMFVNAVYLFVCVRHTWLVTRQSELALAIFFSRCTVTFSHENTDLFGVREFEAIKSEKCPVSRSTNWEELKWKKKNRFC